MNRDSVKGFRTKEDGLKGLTLKYSEFQTRDGVSYIVVIVQRRGKPWKIG